MLFFFVLICVQTKRCQKVLLLILEFETLENGHPETELNYKTQMQIYWQHIIGQFFQGQKESQEKCCLRISLETQLTGTLTQDLKALCGKLI